MVPDKRNLLKEVSPLLLENILIIKNFLDKKNKKIFTNNQELAETFKSFFNSILQNFEKESYLDNNHRICVILTLLSGCGFESSCTHLSFRFHASFEQGVP